MPYRHPEQSRKAHSSPIMNNNTDARRNGALIPGRIMRFTTILLTGILIGCVADSNMGVQEPQGSEPQATEQTAKQPAPSPDGSATASDKPAEAPAKAPVAIVSAPLVQLLGMSRADIIKHLGEPAFQRRDQTALLLRYREVRCILDLYLYPRAQNELGKAVEYFEARAEDGQLIETEPCIDAAWKANAAG